MTLSFQGTYNDRSWIETSFTSFDIACAKINPRTGEHTYGIPTRCGIHLYGLTKTGKTHVALSLGGKISAYLNKAVLHVPIDTFDMETAEQILEYAGVKVAPYLAIESSDYEALDKMVEMYAEQDDICFGILDSIMAIVPVAEENGSTADANMGRRAKLVSVWARKMFAKTKFAKEQKIFLATNHLAQNIGPMPGYHTTGGSAINGLTSLHIRLNKARKGATEIKYDVGHVQGWLLSGKIEKANWSKEGRLFNMFIIGGIGIHPGLTAVQDCLTFGLAESKGKSNPIVYLDGEKTAKISEMVEDWQNDELFAPFQKLIAEQRDTISAQKTKSKKIADKSTDDDEDDVEEAKVEAADALYNE